MEEHIIKFGLEGKNYTAEVTEELIELRKASTQIPIAVYDRQSKESKWYFTHSCGAQGFGLRPEDTCVACDKPGPILAKEMDFGEKVVSSTFNQTLENKLIEFDKKY